MNPAYKIKENKLKKLVGKTIKSVEQCKAKDTDDSGYLKITFTDDSFVFIESYYGDFTGNSYDEYPTGINIFYNINLTETEIIK
jgi:hypothetical protein